MNVSREERARRLAAVEQLMKEQNLQALLAIGNGCVGTNAYGCLRYLTATRVYYYLQAAVFVPGQPPVGMASSAISTEEMQRGGIVEDFRLGPDQVANIIGYLKDQGIVRGRVGTCLEILMQDWAERIEQALPEVELVDISEALFRVRNHHSAEEIALIRECGRLADAGYEAVLQKVKAGMTEQEVSAEIDYATQKLGADYNFTLISTGRFALKNSELPVIRAATMLNQTVQPGSCIAMEITPRLEGYWTQLVRTVSVGQPSEDLVTMHRAVCRIIDETLQELYPGNRIGNIALRLQEATEKAGYIFALPCGHICGYDLNEERLVASNDRPLEVGMAVILHPSVVTPDIPNGIFWGQTYLITETGCERLMNCSDDLMQI